MDARDVIVAPRITEKAMADALAHQYTFVVHPACDEDADPSRDRGDLQGQRAAREHHERSRQSRERLRVADGAVTGKQSDYKKAIITIKAGQKIELGGVNYFEQ